MFNLDKLNETHPEVLQSHGWDKGCIPESLDSFIENLVQRVDRRRFRFEWGGLDLNGEVQVMGLG